MPSKTPKQRRTMAAAAHSSSFAKKLGIPQKVAREFNMADKRKAKKGEVEAVKLTPEQAALKAKGDEAYRKRQEALAKMAKENQQRQADQLKEPKP